MPSSHHLLLDDRLIHQTRHVEHVLGTPQKHPRNPLFSETDVDWGRFDNLYANVVYGDWQLPYRCWCSPFVQWTKNGTRQMRILHIDSHDGIVWRTDKAAFITFENGGESAFGADGPHGAGILQDACDEDSGRRYKMFAKRDEGPRELKQIHVSFSSDGLRWSDPQKCLSIEPAGNTHHNALRDPTSDCYVGFVRRYQPAISQNKSNRREVRTIAMTQSSTFEDWSKCETVLRALEDEEPQRQVYALQVFRYGGIFLGLVSMYDECADSLDCELAWSPDTSSWSRVCPGHSLIARGDRYDVDCIFTAAGPVILDNEVRLYYCGSTGSHKCTERTGHFCLATLQRDRFAGLTTVCGEEVGLIKMKALPYEGGSLHVNADATEGSIEVWIMDSENNRHLLGSMDGRDAIDERITWSKTSPAVRPVTGDTVRLTFKLHNAILYSFSFR